MTRPEHPYASFVQRVQKPRQYLGGEHGEIRKDWDAVDGRMCLAFPDLYEVGMSHLGYRILYSILNKHPKLLAERAYAPWMDMEKELRARGERIRSLENWRPLVDFDVVGFSLQFELTYTNVLLMLELGGISLRSEARTEDEPLIVAGGPVATHAEALAPFIDCFLIGDGEERTPELVLMWTALKRAGVPRAERLRALATLEGIYVPSLYTAARDEQTGLSVVQQPADPSVPFPVTRTFIDDLNRYEFPHDSPVATTETVFDRVSIEIARGCTEGCRFCQAGMIYRPVREREPTSIVRTIEKAVREGGYDEASLTSLSTADYSAIAPLVEDVVRSLKDEKVAISVSSLRAYGLGEKTLDDLKDSRAGGLTFAPEAGTQRMRDVVNKNVTEEQLMETARRVFSRGWDKMKLYFMIGLPTEEDEDVMGIVETGRHARDAGRDVGNRRSEVVVSVSTHVPKPHTPFQWCAMDDQKTVLRKQRMLKDAARAAKLKLRLHESDGSWIEGVLARGDRPLANVLETAYRNGARFDSWTEGLKVHVWEAAFAEHGVDTTPYLATLPIDARLPWDHIDVGLDEGFLAKEYRKALRNRLSPPCGKVAGAFVHHTNVVDALSDSRKLVCYDCGIACDLGQMREERIVHLRRLGAEEARVDVEEAPQERRKGVPVQARFTQGAPLRVRVGFSKVGRLAYSSQLDLVKLMPRMLRRAELPLFYSEGFKPKAVLAFSPALPVGVSSVAEFMDFKLDSSVVQELDAEDLVERLNAVAFEGVTFSGARVLGANDPALGRVLTAAEYVAAIPETVLAELGLSDGAALHRHIEERRRGSLVIRRNTDGIGRSVDVAEQLVTAEGNAGGDAITRAGLVGNLLPVRWTVKISNSGGARLREVLEALIGHADIEARFVRTGIFAGPMEALVSPLDLVQIRANARPSEDLALAVADGAE